jgi:CRP-like cAMP-binding protein
LEQSLRLLVVDPDLASAIQNPAQRRSALQKVTAGRSELVQGEQFDPSLMASGTDRGIVVLSGFLVRELTTTAGRTSADLIGPEDLVCVDNDEPEVAMLRHTVSWTALTDVRLALLDENFFERAAPWPEIAAALLERSGRVGHRLALEGAIATLQSVDARLLASMWTWASQWATVAGQGVVLRIPLSHERIARLIHSRRPTVTTALGRLRRSGLILQRRDGAWLLHGPRAENGQPQSWDGVGMPALTEMLEQNTGMRKTRGETGRADSRLVAARELKARLNEQRETLRQAAKRHEEILERMRREADRLMKHPNGPGKPPR